MKILKSSGQLLTEPQILIQSTESAGCVLKRSTTLFFSLRGPNSTPGQSYSALAGIGRNSYYQILRTFLLSSENLAKIVKSLISLSLKIMVTYETNLYGTLCEIY